VTELLQASYLGQKERQLFLTFEKTARQGGFFVYAEEITFREKLSQE